MKTDIKDIGKKFQHKREELGLSIKEVENATSIRSNHLQAIEEGATGVFMSDVYLYGFIRQYGSFLEMDLVALEQQIPEAFASSTTPHDFEYGIGTLEARGSAHGGVKWFPNVMWAGLTAGILLLAWLVARGLGVL